MRQRYATIRRSGKLARLLIFFLIGCSLTAPTPAVAHARLTGASLTSGSALATMPEAIVLSFSEEIDLAFSSASLLDSNGDSVPLGPLVASSDRLQLSIPVADPASASPDTYTLVWRVLSAVDGHVTTGTLAFSAGTGIAPDVTSGTDARPPWWRIFVRWVELSGLTVVTGLFAFALFIARRPPDALGEAQLRVGRVAAAIAFAAVLVSGYDLGVTAAGDSFLSPPSLGVYRDIVTQSSVGRNWLAVFVCLIFIAIVLFKKRNGPLAAVLGLVVSLAALFAVSAAGHAAAIQPAWQSIALDWLHFASVSCWLGSLPFLWLTLRLHDNAGLAAASVRRFSRLGLAMIVLIVISGVFRAAAEVSGPRSLAQSDYGRVLIAKHVLFVVVLIAAGVNQLVLVPQINRAVALGNRTIGPALASVRRYISIELTAAVLVVVAAAGLTELAPAQAPLPVDVAARPASINQRVTTGDLSVWLLGRLEGAASDRYTITVEDASGHPPADLQRVIVEATTEIDGAVVGDRFDAEPLPGSPGTYAFPAIRLGLPGEWDLDIIVRRAGLEDVAAPLAIDSSEAGIPAPRLIDDEWRLPRITFPAWLFGVLSFASLIGGVVAVKLLRALEPFAAGIILTMTALITAGFAVQGYRQTIPVSAGTALVNPVQPDEGSIQRGEALYRAFCLECHAPDGRGINEENTEHEHAGTSLMDRRTQGQRDGDLFWSISNGTGGTEMPAYDKALTEQERWDLVNYLRALDDLAPLATPEQDS